MNLISLITFILTFTITITGIVWRLASIKASLEQTIKQSKEETIAKINLIEQQFFIHQAQYLERKEFFEYRLHGHDEQIQHKFDRCWAEIKQIQNFLSKDGFTPRDRNKSTD